MGLWVLSCVVAWCALGGELKAVTQAGGLGSRDWKHRIEGTAFKRTGAGEWISPLIRSPFAYDELVYAWHLRYPGDTFRLYLKARFAAGDETEWLYAGYWGRIKEIVKDRKVPVFDDGVLDMDWLRLTRKATGFRFKVLSEGRNGLIEPPDLTVIVTGISPAPPKAPRLDKERKDATEAARVLDVPLRRQLDSSGQRMRDRCQSAALASAMEYFGKSVPLEAITAHTFDSEYNYPGIWPRVIAAACEFGFDGYIDRFRHWSQVRQALAENKVLLCSIRLREGECHAPPYPSMGNHIVVLCGVTDDGRVVVTDSALGKSGTGYLCQWLQEDFEKIWMQTKGGVAMVICPPPGAVVRSVAELRPFPSDRTFPIGDDH